MSLEHCISCVQHYHPSRVFTLIYEPVALVFTCIFTWYEARYSSRLRVLLGYGGYLVCLLLLIVVKCNILQNSWCSCTSSWVKVHLCSTDSSIWSVHEIPVQKLLKNICASSTAKTSQDHSGWNSGDIIATHLQHNMWVAMGQSVENNCWVKCNAMQSEPRCRYHVVNILGILRIRCSTSECKLSNVQRWVDFETWASLWDSIS